MMKKIIGNTKLDFNIKTRKDKLIILMILISMAIISSSVMFFYTKNIEYYEYISFNILTSTILVLCIYVYTQENKKEKEMGLLEELSKVEGQWD